jgi:uncharacterized protein
MSLHANARLPTAALAALLMAASLFARADPPDDQVYFFRSAPTAQSPAKVDLPDPTRFAVAIEAGDIRSVRAWLDAGLEPDFLGDRIGTGLMIAAWEGNIAMMELFVSRGADVNRTNSHQEQALMFAAWKGRADAVRWLMDRGAKINREGLEWSALHYAAFAGHQEVAHLLLERGADINARSTNGSSPLMMAAREGHDQVAQMLVERGADTHIKSDWGDDAAVMAMRYDHVRIAKLVSDPRRFAEVARQTTASFGPPTRSVPLPEKIQALQREMRFADAMGQLTPEARQAYMAAIADLEKEEAQPRTVSEASPAGPPAALEITARRGEPGREKAELIYGGGTAEAAASARVPNAGGPAQKAQKTESASPAR